MEEVLNNLTIYQKVALESDVAELLKGATSDADVLFNLYYLLKHIPEEVKVPFFAIAKEYITAPEDKLNKLILFLSNEEFPEWLWLEKVVADVNVALATCCQDQIPIPIHLDKKTMKQNLVKSAFVKFIRNIAFLSKEHAIKACNAVLEERNLNFLSSVCCSLKEDISSSQFPSKKIDLDDLFRVEIDCKMGLITYTEETEALNRHLMFEENPRKYFQEVEAKEQERQKKPKTRTSVTWGKIDNADIINAAFEQMQSILDGAIAEVQSKKKENISYVVSKAFKGREAEASALKEFESADEARAFVKNLEDQYPELLNTCTFIISEKKQDGRKD